MFIIINQLNYNEITTKMLLPPWDTHTYFGNYHLFYRLQELLVKMLETNFIIFCLLQNKKKKRMSAIFCHNVQPSFDISRKLPLYAIIMIIVVVGSSPNYLGSATKAYSPFSPVYNYVSFILSSDYQLILLYLVLRCIT